MAALRKQPAVDMDLALQSLRVRLSFSGAAAARIFRPALAHLAVPTAGEPDIALHIWDNASTGYFPPRPPFRLDDYHRYGQRGLLDDGRIALMHAPVAGMLFIYERPTRTGFFWSPDVAELSIYERAAPLQTLLYWALMEFGWHLIHAAALGTEHGGIILVGNSGAGKSTTALTALGREGLCYLSDDKCLVRLAPRPEALSLFNSAKLKGDMLEHMPHFKPLVVGWDENYRAGKSLVFLYPEYAHWMIRDFPIAAVVIPRITGGRQPKLAPASAQDAFRVLGPSTVIWMPGAEGRLFKFMAQLVRLLPCYFLDLAREPADNLSVLEGLLQEGARRDEAVFPG